MPRPATDLSGRRFGRWTVIERAPAGKKNAWWVCVCDCGTRKTVVAQVLVGGFSQSCGCLQKELTSRASRRHGLTHSAEYKSWLSMRRRCRDDRRAYYYGRGITVCERWQTFENFLADMGPRPGATYSLERIDNAGNYEPGNVKWATPFEQGQNKRHTLWLTYLGKTMTLSQWADEIGMNRGTIYTRLRHGWPTERALGTPVGSRPKRRPRA